MPKLTLWNYAIWIAGIAMLWIIFTLLVRRRLLRELPVFSAYIFFHMVRSSLGIVLWHTCGVMFNWYYIWLGEAVDGVFTLAVLYEVFSKGLSPYPAIRRTGLMLYFSAAAVLTFAAVWMVLGDPKSLVHRLNSATISMDRSYEFMQMMLLVLLFAIHRLLGLSFRHYVFGVALGLAVETSITTMSATLRLQIGVTWDKIFNILDPMAYDLGLIVWTYYFATAESKLQVTEVPYSPNLARWNTALQQLLAR